MPDPEAESPELRTFDPAENQVPAFGAAVQTLPSDLALPLGEGLQAALTLDHITCRPAPPDNLMCLGWIHNPQAQAYQDVSLEIALLGAEDRSLGEETILLARDWLPPGEGSPFSVVFSISPDEDVLPRVTLISATPSQSANYTQLRVENLSTERDQSLLYLQGEVLNDSPNRVAPVEILAILWGAEGRMLAYRSVELQAIPANSRSSFNSTLSFDGEMGEVTVIADGYQR